MVTNVNGHVVLQSDWEQEVAFEAFSNARDPDSFTSAERNAALDRLIDRELLREQLRPSQPAPADQVAARVAEVRKLYPECATDEAWRAKLQRYGLAQGSLEKRLGDEIQLMKLVEDRLRPSIQIDQQAVETYYHDELLPDMKRAGSRATPLTEVFGQIKDLLAEKKDERTAFWLAGESALWKPYPDSRTQCRRAEPLNRKTGRPTQRTGVTSDHDMTEPSEPSPDSLEPVPPERRRILWKLFLLFCVFSLVAFALLGWYVTTDSFQQTGPPPSDCIGGKLTGGRVELGELHTIPFRLRVDARNLTIHGREASDQVPFLHVDRVQAEMKIISLLSTTIGLHSLGTRASRRPHH